MCSNNMYAVNACALGKRLVGLECYNSKSKNFEGMTEKQVIEKLGRGERIYGFKLETDAEAGKEVLKLDAEGFNMTNMQVKSGVNNITWLKENESTDINMGLVVVATYMKKGSKPTYETVNAKHGRVTYSMEKLQMMMELGISVAGVRLEKNKITVCDGVEVFNDDDASAGNE